MNHEHLNCIPVDQADDVVEINNLNRGKGALVFRTDMDNSNICPTPTDM
jgi:hypothetical protein